MKLPGVKSTERTKLARERPSTPKGNAASVAYAKPDGRVARQPTYLPISRWGMQELEAVLADAAGGSTTAKPV